VLGSPDGLKKFVGYFGSRKKIFSVHKTMFSLRA